uniref:Protein kinase-like domain, phloem protein 2-like protein n=1 Tax=Tanacetum cinerariifolium TaxID=118510 RepID=A0A699JHS2_TANCI|nr:protein kinase-like domain, phloem protein 2-like protein [Tanacetum cinerariifolium]
MLTEVGDFISELRHHGRWKVFSKKYFGHLLKCIIRIPWQTIKPSGGMMCQGVRKEIQTKDVISDLIHFATLGDMQEFVKMLVRGILQILCEPVRFGVVFEIAAGDKFEIKGEIKSEEVSRETTYAAYLVFKLPQHHSSFDAPQQQRSDGSTEVLAWVFQTWTTTEMISMHLELKHPAINNFDESKVIGVGGSGKVYAGELSHFQSEEKSLVAIKRLDRGEMILIYEHASGESLGRFLSSAAVTWTQRLRICLDAAKGLSFLHDPNGTQKRVLHCDIRSANILLDENMTAKVSDFGLSKMGPPNQQYSLLITGALGTPGYCDPVLWRRTP